MGSLTDRPGPSESSGTTSGGDTSGGAVDTAPTTAPMGQADSTGGGSESDRDTVEAPSLTNRGEPVPITRALRYESPLPPPEVMRDYEAIQPGAFDRILKLTEQEQAHRINEAEREGTHRRTVVERDQEAGIADQTLGLNRGTLVLGLVILGVIVCAALDQPWPAAVLAAGAGGIIGIFGWRQRRGNSADQGRP